MHLGPAPPSTNPSKGFARAEDSELLQRAPFYAIVDEADDTLIDDSGTPLIISSEQQPSENLELLYDWSHEIALRLEKHKDFHFEKRGRSVWLSEAGEQKILLHKRSTQLTTFSQEKLLGQIEKSLVAIHTFQNNRDYVVSDEGSIQIVCESTGRILEGRKWKDGLHQAVEVKEQTTLSTGSETSATITLQELFRRYECIAGMTGTAVTARKEFKKYYRLKVTPIRPHKKNIRTHWKPRVFASQRAKSLAIADSVKEILKARRAVLIGTPSVASSMVLSDQLHQSGLEHVVLNALQNNEEAKIIAQAGMPGRVTVATNMAGRGTDIKLHDDVRKAGGLHVIGTELHRSSRIDRQLVGRAARQGDPGSFQFFLSLDDEFLLNFPPAVAQKLRNRIQKHRLPPNAELPSVWFRRLLRLQKLLETQDTNERLKRFKRATEQIRNCQKAGLDPYLEMVGDL